MFKKFLHKLRILYERHFGEYTPVREFDFNKAQKFYEDHQQELVELAFCFGFDEMVWDPIVDGGKLVKPAICFSAVDGVQRTFYDVPCIFYQFKSGKSGKMYCFKEYEYNRYSNTYRYIQFFGIPQKISRFGVFEPYSFGLR